MKKLFVSLLMVTTPLFSAQGQNSEKLTFTVNGVSFSMIKVEGGTFTMGATEEQDDEGQYDEHPLHQVTLSDYYMGETEVTQELWQAVMGNAYCPYDDENPQFPVIIDNWTDCVKFIGKLNALTGKRFHMPSEAQWEFAAKGGNKSQHYKYAGSNDIDEVAWYDNQNNSEASVHIVKTKKPNELGIYDMSGNVGEWCMDLYAHRDKPYRGAVFRGGSWFLDAEFAEVLHRTRNRDASLEYYNLDLGLRLALDDNENIKSIQNDYYYHHDPLSLEDCEKLINEGLGEEAISSLLQHKVDYSKTNDTMSAYFNIVHLLIGSYMQSGRWFEAQEEINDILDFNNHINAQSSDINDTELYILFHLNSAFVKSALNNESSAIDEFDALIKHMNLINYDGDLYNETLYYKVDLCCTLGESENEIQWFEKAKSTLSLLESKCWFHNKTSDYQKEFNNIIIPMLEARISLGFNNIDDGIYFLSNVRQYCEDTDYDHEEYWRSLELLANAFLRKEDKESHDLAVEILEYVSSCQPLHATSKSDLIIAYNWQENKKVCDVLMDYNRMQREECLDVFSQISEAERESFWNQASWSLMKVNNFTASRDSELTFMAYDNVLFTKSLAQLSSDILNKLLWIHKDDLQLQANYIHYCELRNDLEKIYSDKDQMEYYQKDYIPYKKADLLHLEKEILTQYPDYKDHLTASFKTWRDVHKSLSSEDVAIEFTYIPEMISLTNIEYYYGALILRKNDERPIIVKLCKKEELDKLLEDKKGKEQIGSLYADTQLYNIIWNPLEPYFKDKDTIYFSPTGVLNFINHNAIHKSKKRLFSEDYNLVRLSSTSKIEEVKNNTIKDYESALLYGGIIYDLKEEDWKNALAKVDLENDERGEIDVLYATETESDNISIVLGDSLGEDNVKLFQHTDAVEETFKAIDHRAPSIIHLATHAKFADKQEDLNTYSFLLDAPKGYSKQADLLKRTWLLMAGAEYIYKNKRNHLPEGVRDDGYLTAEEISRMDLRGAKLVVMSACETGKGFESIDGIVGLQRGFKKAGAETIVMSLWTVNDESTSYLMQQFYTHLITDKMPAREALKQAQNDTRDNDEHDWKKPYFWAGFVVLD